MSHTFKKGDLIEYKRTCRMKRKRVVLSTMVMPKNKDETQEWVTYAYQLGSEVVLGTVQADKLCVVMPYKNVPVTKETMQTEYVVLVEELEEGRSFKTLASGQDEYHRLKNVNPLLRVTLTERLIVTQTAIRSSVLKDTDTVGHQHNFVRKLLLEVE